MIRSIPTSPVLALFLASSCLVAEGCHSNAAPSPASQTDRTTFFGASRCAAAHVQLCEDFEAGTIDESLWQVTGAVPVVDDVHAARGARALHVTVSGKGSSYIKETRTFPAANDTYFGRAFFYFQSLPAPPLSYAHWTVIAASGTNVSGEIRVGGQFQDGRNLFGVGTDNSVDPNGTGDWTNPDRDPNGAPNDVPVGEWVCLEWMHKGDTSETRFWWDGVEHPSLDTTPTTPHGGNSAEPFILPQFTAVWLGWYEYQVTDEPFELWIDEIAIDGKRIGCAS